MLPAPSKNRPREERGVGCSEPEKYMASLFLSRLFTYDSSERGSGRDSDLCVHPLAQEP